MPPLEINGARQLLLERATLAVGRLDSISTLLPDPHPFLYSYVRREAVLSSQIEGTQSSLSDLLLFELEEAPGTPLEDAVEVSAALGPAEVSAGPDDVLPPAEHVQVRHPCSPGKCGRSSGSIGTVCGVRSWWPPSFRRHSQLTGTQSGVESTPYVIILRS
jgi:hypothetical protein